VFRRPNPSSGVPIYVQLKEQIRHAIETGALAAGDQLPGIRVLAETWVINPNTVIRAYRELEQEDGFEIRHGLGAFVARRPETALGRNSYGTRRGWFGLWWKSYALAA
jgi:GntR family transcriptional regulator